MRSFGIVKILALFALIAFWGAGTVRAFDLCKNDFSAKKELSVTKKISDNSNDELPRLKRKYKPKGVEVTVPHVSVTDVRRFCSYKDFFIPRIKNTGATFLYCVQLERGPPSL